MKTIQYKLYPTKSQEMFLDANLWSSIGIYNWAVKQIQSTCATSFQIQYNKEKYIDKNGKDKVLKTPKNQTSVNISIPLYIMGESQLRSILSKRIEDHSKTCGLSSRLINDTITHAIKSHIRNKKIGMKTKLKGYRNKKSFQYAGDIKFDKKLRLKIPGLKTTIKTHKEDPPGKPKKMVFIKKCSGWYCSVVFDGNRREIEPTGDNEIGIDPGLKTSLTTSLGEEIHFPEFYRDDQVVIAKLQRKSKGSKRLKFRHKKIAARRKDHHHKLTTRLVAENKTICWSNDNFNSLKKLFGKKYSDLALGQIAAMIENKMAFRKDGLGKFERVASRNSTRRCSSCGALSGPKGREQLSVRNWRCDVCSTEHDRDINAAMNALISGIGDTAINEIAA